MKATEQKGGKYELVNEMACKYGGNGRRWEDDGNAGTHALNVAAAARTADAHRGRAQKRIGLAVGLLSALVI
jgi:hypothetical protein